MNDRAPFARDASSTRQQLSTPARAANATAEAIDRAVDLLGGRALDEALVERHLAPLFSRALAKRERAYLANHSLGRPLDFVADDVAEALAAWHDNLGRAWDAWTAEANAYRSRFAALLNAPGAECIVPKTSAGQGLRAILNSYDVPPRVLATRGEFDSVDTILRQYAARKRASVRWIAADAQGHFSTDALVGGVRDGIDLVVVSNVMFASGHVLDRVDALIGEAHASGARVMLDTYHALGAMPLDIAALDADFAIGGSYKYLRGGPGACFLYIHPRHLDGSLSTLDVGWFAKREPYVYEADDVPGLAGGATAFMESTPAVLPFYQARAGQLFTLAVGVDRLRAYSLSRQRLLVRALERHGVEAIGGSEDRGAFVVLRRPDAPALVSALARRGIVTDARGGYLRLGPDLLTTEEELERAASVIAELSAPS